MIKKRATYAFVDFIRGRYDSMKHYDLEFMFNGMTINEKILIRSKDFQTIWMYCYGREPNKNSDKIMYSKSLKKFNQLCNYQNGEFLLDLLNRSSNSELLWEIPKGRIGKNESPIDSAIREFEEETGINKNMYQILFNEGTVEYTFTDGGVKYKYIYYMALIHNIQTPKYDFRNEHMLIEVAELKFLSTNAVFEFNNNRLYKTIRIIIKKLKKYF
jgi:8-oxo-dGTP pyrophosphatase MutT (NUDIX family)